MALPTQISTFDILFKSPFEIFGRQHQNQHFFETIKSLIAPHYNLKSLTTILMCIYAIVYITLACRYPPFIKIPAFALQPLILESEHLKHFEFYRLLTSGFICTDFTNLMIIQVIIWFLGSFTQEIFGWKLFIVFTGFYGLIGYSYSFSIPCFLIGCNFAYALMAWPDPRIRILHRQIGLIVYFIVCLAYFLIFISFQSQLKYSIYSATLYGFLLAFTFGISKDPNQISTFRKIMQLVCGLIFTCITSYLIILIVFFRRTLI